MEVITSGRAGNLAGNAEQTRKERIMLYMKMISESVGGEKQNDEY